MRRNVRAATVHQISIQRMVCTGCGAEANASCNCGKAYVPKAVRAAEAVTANPEKSDRAIAAEIGVSDKTVAKARTAEQSAVERTGLDGKTRKLPERKVEPAPKPGSDEYEQDRKECVALNQKVIDGVREVLIHRAVDAAYHAERFAAALKEHPAAPTPEIIRGVYRVVDKWSALLKAASAANR